mmetsp:Transcript_11660/g.20547  ORF Transcript_11660/g.20547 Transcript_11660/m.20547 type:complete len:332 (+) Transcript_11660:349-1344(+)
MGDTVGVHNLWSSELVLGSVNFTSEEFVQSRETSQDNRTLLHLDDTLAKAHEVGTNTHTSTSDVREGENLVVGSRSFTSNLSTSLKVFDANAVVSTNDITQSPAFADLLGNNRSFWKSLVVFVFEVQVFKSLGWILFVNKFDIDLSLQFVDKTNACSCIACNVDSREVVFTSVFGSLEVKFVLFHAKGTTLDGYIVGNQNNITSIGIFRSLHGNEPCQHTDFVGSNHASAQCNISIGIFNEFLHFEDRGRYVHLLSSVLNVLLPLADKTDLHESKEVVRVSRSNTAGDGAFSLDDVTSAIWVDEAHLSEAIAFRVNNAVLLSNTRDSIRFF